MDAIARAIDAAGGPSKVARRLQVTAQAACFWQSGKRRFPPEHAAALEAISGVPRWDMFPDVWHRIWPELIGTTGAPQPPEPCAAPAPPPALPALAPAQPDDWPTCTRRTERHDEASTSKPPEATHAS